MLDALTNIQTELIEEIEILYCKSCDADSLQHCKEMLIGDNKE